MSIFTGRTLLITGGFGFIGRHLIQELLLHKPLGIHVLAKPSEVAPILHPLVYAHTVDLTDEEAVAKTIPPLQPDFAFMLAAYGTNSAHQDPIIGAKVNVLAGLYVITALAHTPCQHIVHIGTCAEYGNGDTAEHACLTPINTYGSAKAAGTIMFQQLARELNIPITTLRPFGVFGEGEARHKIFSYVIQTALENKDIPLSLCQQMRDYTHVQNIVHAMLLCCENKESAYQIFNVASGVCRPLYYFIEKIIAIANPSITPLYGAISYRSAELWNPQASITKIITMLNWKEIVPLEEGIHRTVSWFIQQKGDDRL